nr:DUF4185 domain-containing protein [Aldersonia kunmingensis]
MSAVAIATLTVTTALAFATPAGANPNAVNPIPLLNGTIGLPRLNGPTQAVAQVTGLASPNNTQNYNVFGTDLGIMWDNGKGEMLTAYGDTAGFGLPNLLLGSFWAWRSNILMRSHDKTPGDGIIYDSVVRDGLGQAKDLVPSPKIPFVEISRIPTAGIAVNGTQYMSMMSVKSWLEPGRWDTNFATIALSGDNGENWIEAPEARRPAAGGDLNFQMSAFVKGNGFVYQYGTPPGRNNSAYLARVVPEQILNLAEYEYWNGKEWRKNDVNAAIPIVPSGVGEVSVAWNQFLGQYVMLTTDAFNSVVMMTSPNPEGPWSPPRVLIDTRALPSAYAPSIYPYQTGSDLYFLTTIHQQYNVVLMRTPLR